MDMTEDSELNHLLVRDGLNGPHLSNGKVKLPAVTNDIVMPQMKPLILNPPSKESKTKPSLTKDGRLQKKRGPKPRPRTQPSSKRPRCSSTRPVPKIVLKNLKVGMVDSPSGRVSIGCLIK